MSDLFGYPMFNDEGVKVLTRTNGAHADMMMNITVFRMEEGKTLTFSFPTEEMALLLIQGGIKISWQGKDVTAERSDFFRQGTTCIHVCKNVPVTVTAMKESEILVQSTENDRTFDSALYTPENCVEETFGQSQFEGKAQRTVRTFFDYHTAPYSNMVMGEILVPQGGWSSYLPHHHPQPEVYYYRFEKPQGFGACFIGDDVYKIKDGSFCAIPGGKTHPQVNAPGYPMYYVWMIRHFDGDPWTDRIFDPAHAWLLGEG
ncbi:5-deoxy-glucuronate isomerase [Caproiciproducens galactitolivorans]|uniref:5-deoxy-glucuronate isomerase n=1 Tax=Caproiciproducens galactitolivorans TaxID=642589 RepID=A0A4Z0YDX4_9FIRM|nr:5-deoxy-glucuronate isomerase [Caproiciproducens galactitolivorans]QEY34576.1 5-deoxy-glucuronate isomerase [Caproiciproducens galactitolivorans]TGJ77635.1 5-deoxy-glucuronate isomerase [Caproiciproducens galactitolivorans]